MNTLDPGIKGPLTRAATKWNGSYPIASFVNDDDALLTVHKGGSGNWYLLRTFMVAGNPLVSTDAVSKRPDDIFEKLEEML